MENPDGLSTDYKEILELGITLGQRRAFGMVAGRCSAANAECLRKIREEKLYLKFAPNWDEFCVRFLKMSRRSADRIIALLKEFGPLYFEVAELTGITASDYRAIQGEIRKDGIHVGGEVIALIPENAERAIEAVARLMAEAAAAAAAPTAPGIPNQLAVLEKRGRDLADAFRRLSKTAGQFERQWLADAVKRVRQELDHLTLEVG